MPSFGTLSPQGSRPAFALRVLVPSPDAHFLSRVKLPRKSARGCFREPGEDMCLPLAQGERRRNRRKLLLHLLRAEAAASSLLLALPQAAAPRRPEATKLAFPTPAQMRNAQDWGDLSRRARPGPESPSRGPAAALGCELSSGSLQQPGDAAHGAARLAPPLGRFCPSCSFSACQDCSTLSVLPRQRLSIHLEACEAPPRAGSVTAGAAEREERRSGGCPSAPPAS